MKEGGKKKTWEEFHKLRDQKISLWNRKQKKSFTKKITEIEENIHQLEKNLSKLKKCYDYDDIE